MVMLKSNEFNLLSFCHRKNGGHLAMRYSATVGQFVTFREGKPTSDTP